MKKILFLLAFTVLVACHKKSSHPAPVNDNTSQVQIAFHSSDNNGMQIHIKSKTEFSYWYSSNTSSFSYYSDNTADSSSFDHFVSAPGESSICTFKKGDHVYLTSPKYGTSLTVIQTGVNPHTQFTFTYGSNLAYDFIVQ